MFSRIASTYGLSFGVSSRIVESTLTTCKLRSRASHKIAFAQGAENRVGNRMGQRICVRVPFSATIGSDVHATQYKLTPFN
jgi:hypothetical protein